MHGQQIKDTLGDTKEDTASGTRHKQTSPDKQRLKMANPVFLETE